MTNYMSVPCGKCPVCLDNRREDWFVRLNEEMKTSSLPLFVTLTYDEDFLPRNKNNIPSVCKEDCQKFLKRLRKRIDSDQQSLTFRYFIAAEYGSSGKRPHYHMCIFFYFEWSDESQFKEIHEYCKWLFTKCWNKGFVDVGVLSPGGINYVSKYIHKKKLPPQGANMTFQLQSKGLGVDYITCSTYDYHKENIVKHNKYVDHQRTYRLPRYYREKIYEEEEKQILLDNHNETIRKQFEEIPSPIKERELWELFMQRKESQIKGKEYQIRKRLKMSSGVLDE